MKKSPILVIIGLLLMISGCTSSSLVIQEGTYTLTANTNWDNVDINYNTQAGMKLFSGYTQWQNKSDLEFLIDQPVVEKYGTLVLGNNQEVFNFAITKEDNFINKIYFDRNGDGVVYDDEVIVPVFKNKETVNGYDFYESYTTDFPVYVEYLKSDGNKASKVIYLSLAFFHSPKVQNGPSIVMLYRVVTYFKGEAAITYKNESKTVKFVLIDGNNNGVFNDYGTDFLIVDKNYNGKYNFSSEKQGLLELFEASLKDQSGEKVKKTFRVSAFAYPEKIIVNDVNVDAPEAAAFEPLEDDDWDKANENQKLIDLLQSMLDNAKK